MIQRPQSIFLAIVILCQVFVLTGVRIWTKIDVSSNEVFVNITQLQQLANGKVISESSHFGLLGILGASTLLTIGILFSFKNRMRQMMMGLINSMLIAGTVGYAFFIIFKQAIPLFAAEQNGKYDLGFYALVIALLGNMIANRLIRKDEMLVRSSDRMR